MKLDDVKKLQQKKYREELGHFLVEGEHLVLELQKAAEKIPALKQSELYITETYADWPSEFRKNVVTEKQMSQISDTKTPQGIVAVVPFLPKSLTAREGEQAIYLHEVQDPGNLGTIVRTLAWFGNFRLLLSPNSVDPYNPKVVRSSMGAIFHLPMELDVSLAEVNQRYNKIACLDMQGDKTSDAIFKEFDCYLFGNEARGLPHELLTDICVHSFSIPGSGAIDSLNLASAVNMCAYELVR